MTGVGMGVALGLCGAVWRTWTVRRTESGSEWLGGLLSFVRTAYRAVSDFCFFSREYF